MFTLGIDSGTQSTKTIVLDTESGVIVASAQSGYGMMEGLPPGHMEQEPGTWVTAVDRTVRACLQKLGAGREQVKAIGVSGQQHGMVVLNKRNESIRPAKLWCDTSTLPQCEQFNAEFGGPAGLIELAGNPILPGYTAPKILWLKQNEPANYEAASSFLLPHDYINWWLTGEKRMEYGDASGAGLMNVRTRQWAKELMDFIDPDLINRLPRPESSTKPAGLLRENLRKEWGLEKSPVVSAGGGDNMMGAIGTGNIAPGILTASLGTSGTLYSFSEEPVVDLEGEVAAFCDSTDHWLPLVCTMNVTAASEAARNLFKWDHATLESALHAAPPGAGGLLFLPYLNGERTPNLPRGTGIFHGFTTANMQSHLIARATVEGATLGLAYGLSRLRDLGVVSSEIRLTGGGSNSASWRQIAADAFGAPTVCLKSSEGAALGAAIQAAWTYQTVNGAPVSLRDLTRRLVEPDEATRRRPDPKNQAIYGELLGKQSDLTRKLKACGYL